ncbi:hypothetical protein DFH06DRAFT_1351537 [Mycena polygramma]|nr:hypothetical protein DFH06DRAFT_1351537 [Mycena polygramma]
MDAQSTSTSTDTVAEDDVHTSTSTSTGTVTEDKGHASTSTSTSTVTEDNVHATSTSTDTNPSGLPVLPIEDALDGAKVLAYFRELQLPKYKEAWQAWAAAEWAKDPEKARRAQQAELEECLRILGE